MSVGEGSAVHPKQERWAQSCLKALGVPASEGTDTFFGLRNSLS